MTQQQQSIAEQALYQRLVPQDWLQTASDIGFYWPADSEISPLATLNWCLKNSKNCYLPIVSDGHDETSPALLFQPYQTSTSLNFNRFNIPEPSLKRTSAVEAAQLDVIIVPLVGFNRACFRLGMGGGYYDRVLSKANSGQVQPLLIGVGHSCQECQFPVQGWDVAMDFIVTDLEIIAAGENHPT